ncbi:MAG: hypothetical protein ACRDG2_10205, partial [Actinomycetota bacterium]
MPGESIRDRLATLSRAELIALVAVVGVTLTGAGFWYVRSLPAPVQVRSGPSEALVAAPTASASPTTVI